MEIIREQSEGRNRLCLMGECNIYSAGELRPVLLEALNEPRDLELDLSAVTEIDTAGLQVLMAAKNMARSAGQDVRLLSHSQPVLELIEIYDLAVWLGDPLIVSAAAAATA